MQNFYFLVGVLLWHCQEEILSLRNCWRISSFPIKPYKNAKKPYFQFSPDTSLVTNFKRSFVFCSNVMHSRGPSAVIAEYCFSYSNRFGCKFTEQRGREQYVCTSPDSLRSYFKMYLNYWELLLVLYIYYIYIPNSGFGIVKVWITMPTKEHYTALFICS